MARHKATPENRNSVRVMIGLGAPLNIVAGALNISPDTLSKVYATEIQEGPDSVRLEAMRQLFAASKTADGAGRVSAAVKLLDMLSADDGKPDPGAAGVRPSGLPMRVLPYSQSMSLKLYDQDGTQVFLMSDAECNM
jgi:hypothetical protein